MDSRSLSAAANAALRETVEVELHRKALQEWLEELYEEHGRPSAEDYAAAEAVLDEALRGTPGRATRRQGAAFDVLDTPRRSSKLWALLELTLHEGGQVRCAAVTLAEVCRGPDRTRRVEYAIAGRHKGQRIRVIPTDERMAKRVGAILHSTHSGSERLADAHVVAVCADADVAVVVTSDPDDITELSTAVPGTRVTVRRPSLR